MLKAKEIISIIIPCYNEEESVPLFYNKITELADEMNYVDFEFIFINDGSKDSTIKEIKKLNKIDNSGYNRC